MNLRLEWTDNAVQRAFALYVAIWVLFLAPHINPQAPPGVIFECSAMSKL